MAKTKRITALLLTLVMIVCIIPFSVFADEPPANGWYEDKSGGDSYWYYYVDGEPATGWKKIGKKWYYFYGDGQMASNEIIQPDSESIPYYVDESGAMVTKVGWCKFTFSFDPDQNVYWVYVTKGGALARGWKKVGGKWYFLNSYYGIMSSNTVVSSDDKNFYIVGKDGVMSTKKGWRNLNAYGMSLWFYAKKGGLLKLGWYQEKGNWYYFEKKHGGLMVFNTTAWQIGDKYYDFDENGVCTTPDGYIIT